MCRKDGMVNRHTSEIFDGVPKAVKGSDLDLPDIRSGHDAAVALVELMQSTFEFMDPPEIVNAFNEAKEAGDKPSQIGAVISNSFWQRDFGVIRRCTPILSRFVARLALNNSQERGNVAGGGVGRYTIGSPPQYSPVV
jgi:hypothetical protein